MVLLSILAIGMLTLSTVSLRTSTQSQDRRTARANARMAMMIAIGELQRTIGPDQRVTAPADLKNPSAAMPQWVGVYGNNTGANYDDAPNTISPTEPVLLNWLVSGNTSQGFEFSKDAEDFGKITTPPTDILFDPTDPVSNIAGATANSTNLSINGTKAALLVGPNSAGPYDASRNQFVAAPIVATKNDSNQVNGGYAYWVGDEGTKARIDLQDNYRTATADVNKAKSYSLVSQRAGIESMRRNTSSTDEIGPDYDPASDRIRSLVTTDQFSLLNSTALSGVTEARFHDLTAYSSSVLADSYAGGLKLNLSAALRGAGPADSEVIFKPVSTDDFGLPTWGLLRSWASIKAARNSPAAPAPITPRPFDPSSGIAGFGPVISTCALAFGMEKGDTSNSLRIQLYPVAILWNPHAAPIAAADYELGMAERNGGTIDIHLKTKDGASTSFGYFSLARGDRPTIVTDPSVVSDDASSGTGFFRFRVQGSVIPPGESHIYVLDPSQVGTPYVPGGSTLVRANEDLPLGVTRYLTGPSITYPEAQYMDGAESNKRAQLRLRTSTTGMSFGDSNGGGNNTMGLAGDRFQAVLTSPGQLSSGFSDTTPVYQAVMENCASAYIHGPNNVQGQNIYLSDYDNGTAGLAPIFAIRTKMVMEAHHDNSHAPYVGAMGMQRGNRWLATANPLAPYTKRTKTEFAYNGGNPVHGGAVVNSWSASFNHFIGMSSNHSPHYRAGIGVDQTGNGSRNPVIMSDVLPDDLPLLSLGQLQHAPFSVYGFTPTYVFGNSKLDLRFKGNRDKTYLPDFVAPPGASSPGDFSDTLYDLPWHLNRALWDGTSFPACRMI